MIDLEEIKQHRARWTPDDSTSLPTICEHVDALVAEVERLRGEAERERAAEEDLVRVLRRVLDENKLREAHGEDTIGVLMKCGAFHDTEVAALAARIDAVEL